MLSLAIKLIEKCIELLKIKQQNRRNYFNEIIHPLFSDFEVLHDNYLNSFENYRDLIISSKDLGDKHPIFDKIVKEHLFTQNIRSKIEETFKLFPEDPNSFRIDRENNKTISPSKNARKMDDIEEFVYSINIYFDCNSNRMFENDLSMWSNWPRSSLISGLKYILSLNFDDALSIISLLEKSPQVSIVNSDNKKIIDKIDPTAIANIAVNPSEQHTDLLSKVDEFYLFSFYFFEDENFPKAYKEKFNITMVGIFDRLKSELKNVNRDMNKIKILLATSLIDTIVAQLQSDYRDVIQHFNKIKTKLL